MCMLVYMRNTFFLVFVHYEPFPFDQRDYP